MTIKTKHNILTIVIAFVWLINGLICKVLNVVPRHQEIVAEIAGDTHARTLTLLIGFAEIAMVVWIVSGIYPRVNAIMQILVIGLMNVLEFFITPELLLWGRVNILFALLFILLIYYNEFHLNTRAALHS